MAAIVGGTLGAGAPIAIVVGAIGCGATSGYSMLQYALGK